MKMKCSGDCKDCKLYDKDAGKCMLRLIVDYLEVQTQLLSEIRRAVVRRWG